jgi:hypothetical protein
MSICAFFFCYFHFFFFFFFGVPLMIGSFTGRKNRQCKLWQACRVQEGRHQYAAGRRKRRSSE